MTSATEKIDEFRIAGHVDGIGETVVKVKRIDGLREWVDLSQVSESDKPKLKLGARVEIHRYRELSNGHVRRIEEVVFP